MGAGYSLTVVPMVRVHLYAVLIYGRSSMHRDKLFRFVRPIKGVSQARVLLLVTLLLRAKAT
jgi:hypothetical protein